MVTTRNDFNKNPHFLYADAPVSSHARQALDQLLLALPKDGTDVVNLAAVYAAQTLLECTESPLLRPLRTALSGDNAVVTYHEISGYSAVGNVASKLLDALKNFSDAEGRGLVTAEAKECLSEIARVRTVYAQMGYSGCAGVTTAHLHP